MTLDNVSQPGTPIVERPRLTELGSGTVEVQAQSVRGASAVEVEELDLHAYIHSPARMTLEPSSELSDGSASDIVEV